MFAALLLLCTLNTDDCSVNHARSTFASKEDCVAAVYEHWKNGGYVDVWRPEGLDPDQKTDLRDFTCVNMDADLI